ncbi:MAG: hypothetical protein CO186_02390 [Zetaproteobacteria bacterium CG_4_9_14_3_um_filter_49_83]|nr:MAG: hypothetical protein AUJ56_06435 [Zetaproteobacteria bacterium CG1_02_49_23]PIQ33456.1 MAG: hypothetical protein COW62_05155 [Zetaproteobacteria bacterium CG17_big_fil_post_rev_8_21_14_2_50_50_13]PIV30316.1 MAG: hypothetical protein COS35_07290 [Zetaproteobacteria bacterium CG02_land_8_20_14_3_00_50_9]PIY55663.1 MAG: hypothetical protein COZ00_08220 [Zetaproteobacteria bacterium CG_4_10_14_0_8_um_filter_49_80]PJA36013.1 MAG: hypothetical protein CO186_02390 [Zetaproteobacteria bacterium
MNRFILVALLALTVSPALVSAGDTGTDILENSCSSCHDLKGPAPQTIHALWKRDAPDLFYAGNKFQREWLIEWLQKPVRIRPAGVNYLRTINSTPINQDVSKKGRKYDVLWGEVLKPLKHVTLNKDNAEAVADALMQLTPNNDLTAEMALDDAQDVDLDSGELLIDKVYGCLSCHQIEPGYGGYTGAELYTAGKRLQAEYMLSYIKRPKNWDPKIWMPNGNVKPDDLQKIANYLILLSKEDFNASN